MIERNNPLLNQEEPKHGHLMTARVTMLKWHMIERGNPLLKHTDNVPDGSQTRSFQESIRFNVGDESNRDRTETPVVGRDTSHEPGDEQSTPNEENIDFRILGLSHSVVQQDQNSRVCELVKKIENHAHRHALQRDLQQNKAYNPFSAKSKQIIQDVGSVELFELFESDLKSHCKACLPHSSGRHRLLHMLASLERNSGQSKIHGVYAGPSFNSRIRNQFWEDLMDTDVGNFQKIRNIIWHIIQQRDASSGNSHRSMIDSCEIMFSVNG